jgi:type II secretory pathway pseudopilin PulG
MTGQGNMAIRMRRQPRSWQRTTNLPIQRIHRDSGFSLVELMIVAGLTAVVLAGLGALALVSDVKVGRRMNSIQEAQEQWGRSVIFIKNEVADASTLSSGPLASADYPCNGELPDPALVLKGPLKPDKTPYWTVIYGVRNRAVGEEGLYRGPKLLVRCGPQPLASARNPANLQLEAIYGHLDETQVGVVPQAQTVLLDRLPAGTPLQLTLLADPAKGPVYDAQLSLTMQADTDTTIGGDQPFRVHVQRSP